MGGSVRCFAWLSTGEIDMQKCLLLTTALAMSVAAPAFAEVGIGDKAPAISADAWHNLPKETESLTPAHLKGQIVMVEFWATW